MNVERCQIQDVLVIKPRCFLDGRGGFSEVYSQRSWEKFGISVNFCQDNIASSTEAGTVRGLHFQSPPSAQSKLIWVMRGAILDVVVDIRRGSPWFGQAVTMELSADNRLQLFIPRGFAHGYCTLSDKTEVFYKVDAFYAPAAEGGLVWNDPDLALPWPAVANPSSVNDRDNSWPKFGDFDSPFRYETATP